ncbi:MAG: hypothetical protein NZM04_00930 [Methylacidiphilales bacterium]|nr:hypothetical protein [Candidatus Methylacidiphilales bacterium]MDW8350203.1 DUF6036 family nucleotidyltransferase [Verrucomicrobiae bacterium]
MPLRQLHLPHQVEDWLNELSATLTQPASLILIGSGALLWHAAQRGLHIPLPENSMDIDPISDDEEVIAHCYQALIGSEFELRHGWHVNLMPTEALHHLPHDWPTRASQKKYGLLTVTVPAPQDLIVPKRLRNEPRDILHIQWTQQHLLSP